MNIIHISKLNFNATPARMLSVEKPTINNVNNVKDALYADINDFIGKKCGKKEYLTRFMDNLKNFDNSVEFNKYEKKYISNLLIFLDLNGDIKKIPNKYLEDLMNELLANKG